MTWLYVVWRRRNATSVFSVNMLHHFFNRVGTYNFDVSTTFPLTDKDSYYFDGL